VKIGVFLSGTVSGKSGKKERFKPSEVEIWTANIKNLVNSAILAYS
jgi:hypothetical protein